jgi:hypothetical protein
MAGRPIGKRHQDDVRAKIQASQLVNVLQNHALGLTEELSASRMKAIEILLRKSVPDLSSVELSNPDGEEFKTVTRIERVIVRPANTDA